MFRSRRFENPYDPDDDGRDLEITPEEEAASDDQGREEAKVFIDQMGTKERNQNDRNFRRWLLRLAKKALAEGAERRRIAGRKEKARAAAEAEAERRREENAAKAAKSRRAFERYCRESDERWARTDEETRAANAEWQAGRPAREAAERAARVKSPKSIANADTSGNSVAPRFSEPSPREISTPVAPAARKAASKPAPQPRAAALGAAARPTPTTAAPTGQPRREPATSVMLNPPSTLRPFTPPAVGKAARPAPPPAPPIAATPASPMRSNARPSPSSETGRSTPSGRPIPMLASSQPLPPPPPPVAPAPPEPPPFTGADLAAYRTSLGLSQGALAGRLGTTQGTVSKAEGNPTALLGPTLRRAMWEAQRGA